MEASSPLAAMHRPMPVPSWGGPDMFRSYPHSHYNPASAATATMSLREQLAKGTADYFNVKDIRGGSPAASLAADLSQNFRLDNDASPQFPTPRRALFTASTIDGLDKMRGYATTPPLPSSSPAPMVENMEISPLPHKGRFVSQVEITTPTPIASPTSPTDEEMVLDSPAPIPRQPSLEPKADRKIAAPRRPSLSRMKGLTTSAIPGCGSPDSQLPTLGPARDSSRLSLSECFDDSPPQDGRPLSSNSPCPPIPLALRSRPQFAGVGGSSSRHGSPANGRRSANPFLRSRKQVRRSLSMFEHPGDVMKPKAQPQESTPSSLQSVMDIEEVQEPALPHMMADDPADTIPRISKETLLDVLDGKYADKYDQKMIIDCRFEYEYEGGHVDGAVNYNDKELLASQLFQTPMTGRTLLVFHCEYSAHRAPLMARHVRSEDRTANAEHYPRLTYPDVYILEGGYSAFFAGHRERCYPPAYVEMSDANHQRTCEREMGRLKQRKGFNRAQTFAFGQREPCVDDSPTAPSRPSSRQASFFAASPIFGERSHARRMASY